MSKEDGGPAFPLGYKEMNATDGATACAVLCILLAAAALGGSLAGRGFIVADCERIGGAVVGSAVIKCEIVRSVGK